MGASARTPTVLPALAMAMALAATPAPSFAAEELPVPEGLRTEIDFWKRVFGEAGRDRGLVHDSHYPAVLLVELAQAGKRVSVALGSIARSA